MPKMTTKKLVLNLFPFFILLLLADFAGAQDFTASTLPSVELCPCSSQAYAVTVQNTGSLANTYTVAASGDAANFVKFNPSKFALEPGQSGNFFVVVNSACNIKGNFDLEILITADNGLTKAIKQALKINECYDYSLQEGNAVDAAEENVGYVQHDGAYLICTDEQKAIPILITNNENFGNEYSIFLDAPEWAKLNVDKARLDAKKSGVVLINYDATGILGKFDLKIAAISELGKVQRKKSIEVNAEKCYDLDLSFEKEDIVCGGETTEYNIIIKNKGAISQKVVLEIAGPQWAGLGNNSNSFTLSPREEEKITLSLAPEQDVSGMFDISAAATPDNKTAFKVSNVANINVIDKAACYQADISAKAAVNNLYKEDFFFAKVTNKGAKKAAYNAALEGPSWVSLNPEILELNQGQTGNLNVKISPSDDIEPNTYGIKIILESNGAIYSKDIDIKLRKETGLEKNFKAAFKAYQYYFYLLIAVITLILIFIKPIIRTKDKIKTRYKKYKSRQARMKILRIAREKRQEERKKQKEQEEKTRERQEKKEAQKIKRKDKEFFKKHKAWAYSIIALIILIFTGDYFKLYNLKYTNIYIRNIFVGYLYYILIGIGVAAALFLLVMLYNHIGRKKKAKKTVNEAKKAEKKVKIGRKWYNKPLFILAILIIIIALITSLAYFSYFDKVKDFVVVYSYYFALGVVILIIIIAVLSFYKPAI